MMFQKIKWWTWFFLLLFPLLTFNILSAATSPDTDRTLESHQLTNDLEIEYVAHIGGLSSAVFVQGNYAYIGQGQRLTILDISNPTSPLEPPHLFVIMLDHRNGIVWNPSILRAGKI